MGYMGDMIWKDMKRTRRTLLFALIMAVCLVGCTGGKKAETPGTSAADGDWRTKGFVLPGKEETENLLWAGEFLAWQGEESAGRDDEESVLAAASRGSTLYQFSSIYKKNGEEMTFDHYRLESWDPDSNERSTWKLMQEDLFGKEDHYANFRDLYVTGQEQFVLWWESVNRKEDGTYQPAAEELLWLDEGGVVKTLDLTEELTKRALLEKSPRCLVDDSDNIFVMAGGNPGNAAIYVFDKELKKLAEWIGGEEASFTDDMRNEDDEYVFVISNVAERADQFYYFDKEKKNIRCLAQLGLGNTARSYLGMHGDRIYYQSEQFIYEWNVTTGTNEKRFDLQENGIAKSYHVIPGFSKDEALSYLWLQSREDSLVTKLSAEKKEKDALKVVDLLRNNKGSKMVSDCCSRYSETDISHLVSYKAMSTKEGRDRTLAQLLSGEGPDLMYVSREDLDILSKQGALMDLRDLISEETLNDLLPAAIAMGTVDGELLGIPGRVNAIGIWVPDQVWSGSTWTLEDVIELLETQRLETCVYYPGIEGFYWPLASVRILTKDWKHSFLYDEATGECHFDDERFVKLLRIAKNAYKPDNADGWYEQENRMVDITVTAADQLRAFGLEAGKEKSHIVGIPTNGGNGCFLDADGCLVVNAKSTHKKEISEFLEIFLSERIHNMSCGLSIRKYPLERLSPDGEGRIWFKATGMKDPEELVVYEDGTTPVHRAEAFLENCVPFPIVDSVVDNILYEELDAFFFGEDKTPEEVCNVIQSRVWLYLKESE